MKLATGPMPTWLKNAISIAGLLLALAGLPLLVASPCAMLYLAMESGPESAGMGLVLFTLLALTVGAGSIVFWHGRRSLGGKPSAALRLPPAWLLAAVLGLCIAVGVIIYEGGLATGVFFPPILLVAAALPSILAVSWFTNGQAEGLSWRRGLVAFAGGATVSVALAILLEILFPFLLLILVLNLNEGVLDHGQALLTALAGKDIASAIANPGFIYAFVLLAIIAPLAEELVKPLVTLPLIGRLARRDAFLVAAMAGAGFAALENMMYAGLGLYFWAGILIVRALGGAIHPLGAGLVGLAWRDILQGEPHAWRNGFARLAFAMGVHAAWNGGSLFVITLAGARFFGQLPPEINILGLSATGTSLAFLIVLGLAALWLGRTLAQRAVLPGMLEGVPPEAQFELSDRAVAIWALACLVALVPAGIAGLRLLVH